MFHGRTDVKYRSEKILSVGKQKQIIKVQECGGQNQEHRYMSLIRAVLFRITKQTPKGLL